MVSINSASRRSSRLGRTAVTAAVLLSIILLSQAAIWCYGAPAASAAGGDVKLRSDARSQEAGNPFVLQGALPLTSKEGALRVIVEPEEPVRGVQGFHMGEHLRRERLALLVRDSGKHGDRRGGSGVDGDARPGTDPEPELPDRTVVWKGDALVLRELGQPVSVPLDGEAYPERRVTLEVTAADGTCRLVVDRGVVLVDGVPLRLGESCVVRLGAEVTWEGTAGIRLEDPRKVDVLQGSG